MNSLRHSTAKALLTAKRGFKEERGKALSRNTDQSAWIEEFRKHEGISSLSRNDLIHMIRKIEVVDSKRIVVHFRFMDEFEAPAGAVGSCMEGDAV